MKLSLKIKTLAFIGLSTFSLFATAQKVEIERKTDLVSVDGKPAFYMIEKNKQFGVADYSLQTLDNKEIAFFKLNAGEPYIDAKGFRHTDIRFNVTFVKSGNTCVISDYTTNSYQKSLAKEIAESRVLNGNELNQEGEKVFILSHNGTFFIDPNAPKDPIVNVNINNGGETTKTSGSGVSVNIFIKAGKVYSNDELVASYKENQSGDIRTLLIYNSSDEKIAEASENTTTADDDWNIVSATDGKKSSVLYNSTSPLEKLFEYLVKKGILK